MKGKIICLDVINVVTIVQKNVTQNVKGVNNE